MDAAAEHDQAAAGGAKDEQRDQAERLSRRRNARGKADGHPRRVAAHEGDEQAAEMQVADAVDIAGERAERAGQRNVAAESSMLGTIAVPETATVFMKSAGLKRTAGEVSKRLQIFKQRFLLIRSQVRAEVVTAIAVARVELVAAGDSAGRARRILRLGETDFFNVVFRTKTE